MIESPSGALTLLLLEIYGLYLVSICVYILSRFSIPSDTTQFCIRMNFWSNVEWMSSFVLALYVCCVGAFQENLHIPFALILGPFALWHLVKFIKDPNHAWALESIHKPTIRDRLLKMYVGKMSLYIIFSALTFVQLLLVSFPYITMHVIHLIKGSQLFDSFLPKLDFHKLPAL